MTTTPVTLCSRCDQPLDLTRQTHRNPDGSVRHYNRGECQRAVAVAADAQRIAAATRATAKQVAFAEELIQTCWTPAVFGRARYTRAELTAMPRAEISRVIDALLAERREQEG